MMQMPRPIRRCGSPIPRAFPHGATMTSSSSSARTSVWPNVWQMACRLEEIPDVGDWVEYKILDKSVIVIRTEQRHQGVPQRLPPSRRAAGRRPGQLLRPTASSARSTAGAGTWTARTPSSSGEQSSAMRTCDRGRYRAGALPRRILGRLRLHQFRRRRPGADRYLGPAAERLDARNVAELKIGLVAFGRSCRSTGSSRWRPSWKAITSLRTHPQLHALSMPESLIATARTRRQAAVRRPPRQSAQRLCRRDDRAYGQAERGHGGHGPPRPKSAIAESLRDMDCPNDIGASAGGRSTPSCAKRSPVRAAPAACRCPISIELAATRYPFKRGRISVPASLPAADVRRDVGLSHPTADRRDLPVRDLVAGVPARRSGARTPTGPKPLRMTIQNFPKSRARTIPTCRSSSSACTPGFEHMRLSPDGGRADQQLPAADRWLSRRTAQGDAGARFGADLRWSRQSGGGYRILTPSRYG